jgi:hypothetical protein
MPPPSSNSRRGIARQASVGVMGPGRKPLSKLLQLDRTLLMPFFTWCYQVRRSPVVCMVVRAAHAVGA